MAEFRANLPKETVERMPTPAHLATVLCQNEGYLFAGVREEDMNRMEHVPIYNLQQHIGYVSYMKKENGSVDVHIIDVENSQGDILTRAARRASKQSNYL